MIEGLLWCNLFVINSWEKKAPSCSAGGWLGITVGFQWDKSPHG